MLVKNKIMYYAAESHKRNSSRKYENTKKKKMIEYHNSEIRIPKSEIKGFLSA